MTVIAASLRRAVVSRADNRCEYCQLSQLGQEATFHVDHVTPVATGGPTTLENLALACVSCSLKKGARESARDPSTGDETPLFNPRTQAWGEHFEWSAGRVVPRTAVARATVELLQLNRPMLVRIREVEAVLGRHPPGANAH